MASNFAVCITAFENAGIHYNVGDVVEDDSEVYVLHPTFFSKMHAYVPGNAGTSLTGGTLGTVIAGKLPVTNEAGTVLGWAPLYNEITGS